jgi:hypothetical protein
MKILIAITTCEQYRRDGTNDAVRDTWLKSLDRDKANAIFFTGDDSWDTLSHAEVRLDVPDDYEAVTNKTIESVRWALNRGYEFIFRTYPDVYIRPERLIDALMPDKAYVGYPMMGANGVPYASGGAGYWLRAAEAAYLLDTMVPYDWAEDRWVGNVMHEHHVTLWGDGRYSPIAYAPLKRNQQITSHMSRPGEDGKSGTYDKQWMYNTHKVWTLSQTI